MELGVCPIREEELVGVIRGLLAKTPARPTTGVPEIDRLTDARARAILARVYRFMYQRRDGTWDQDKDIPGAELVSLLCSELPEVGRHEEGPDPAGGLVARLEGAGADDSALDDLVHDLASSIGSGVNNEGFAGQVRFLLDEMGLEAGAREIEKVIRGATHKKRSVKR